MKLSIILVNWNGGDCIGRCLDSIPGAVADLESEVIVVDNASTDMSPEIVKGRFPGVRLIENRENQGFGRGVRTGVEAATGDYLAVVNPDVVLGPGSLSHLVGFLEESPTVAWVGPKIVQPDGAVHSEAFSLGTMFEPVRLIPGVNRLWPPRKTAHDAPQRCGKLRGSCMALRASMLADVGGMPCCTFLYGEEQVLGSRFRERGHEVWYDPRSVVVHERGFSARQMWTSDDAKLAARVGHTEAMRRTLGYPRFVVYDTILVGALLLRLGAGFFGRGHHPALVWRMVKASMAAPAGPPMVGPWRASGDAWEGDHRG